MLHRLEKLLLDLAAVAVIGLGLLITAQVGLRTFANSSIPDAIVMVRELMVAAIVLPAAAVTANRAHIAVEVVSNRLPSRAQDALLIFGTIVGLLGLLPLIYAGWREAYGAIAEGGYFFGDLNLPRWPGRVIFLFGITLCWVRLALMLATDLGHWRRGEPIPAAEPVHRVEEV
ncbi:Tripartite ATP-independent periplasmic transporters, DctQ component [Roseivivax jejudonensis]|uniref:TRAP transporter small permease protein n=1 Tax=Roseivivax jejudonensis TaxID=1529041 RepID=A0A1X6YJK9_9RHOB|nr:TRAP transporter small permease [Roseivivax jejudonensis]SLN23589.1 Tripartite ATP-independent periplasmic transporters, DctQ component [Roseivivax jejudonensis]